MDTNTADRTDRADGNDTADKNLSNTNTKKKTPELLQEKFGQLDAILEQLQKSDISLEEAFAKYQEGVKLVKECNDQIERVEKQVQILSQESGQE